ncbi:uncharacterized protein ACIBXB_012801 [Morphnus guianensis]
MPWPLLVSCGEPGPSHAPGPGAATRHRARGGVSGTVRCRGAAMEPVPRGRPQRAGLSVFACYDQLRREIQALLAENEELTRAVGRLKEQRHLRHLLHGQPGTAPSSAPPLAAVPRSGRGGFAFPSPGGGMGGPTVVPGQWVPRLQTTPPHLLPQPMPRTGSWHPWSRA